MGKDYIEWDSMEGWQSLLIEEVLVPNKTRDLSKYWSENYLKGIIVHLRGLVKFIQWYDILVPQKLMWDKAALRGIKTQTMEALVGLYSVV